MNLVILIVICSPNAFIGFEKEKSARDQKSNKSKIFADSTFTCMKFFYILQF